MDSKVKSKPFRSTVLNSKEAIIWFLNKQEKGVTKKSEEEFLERVKKYESRFNFE